jgi:hypothetical protein
MIVFNDSYKSEGFEIGIEEANKILIDLGLHLEYKFIEDYVSDNGEYAYTLTVVMCNHDVFVDNPDTYYKLKQKDKDNAKDKETTDNS